MTMKKTLFTALVILFSQPALGAENCSFDSWKTYQGDELLKHSSSSAYFFASTHIAIDADGAPNAYHPDDTGLDYLANAGYPGSFWGRLFPWFKEPGWTSVLVQDPNNRKEPYVQPNGPFTGYFVSKTALVDKTHQKTDPKRYVDATQIPYLVFPGSFVGMGGTGRMGDLGYAINLSTNESSPFVVADVGPQNAKLGEISISLAERLGGKNVSPRDASGAPRGQILYVVFPHSSIDYPWPQSSVEMAVHAQALLDSVGGAEAAKACLEQ